MTATAVLPAWAVDPARPSAAEIAAFRRDGHVVLRGLCTPAEVAVVRDAAIAASAARQRERVAGGEAARQAFLQGLNVHRSSPTLAAFVHGARFAAIAAALLGCDGIRLLHAQTLFKEAGGAPTPWHQDGAYWPLHGLRSLGMWLPLRACGPRDGALRFVSGSHRLGWLGEQVISRTAQEQHETLIARERLPIVAETYAVGDASFHLGWILHGADANAGEAMREAMNVSFYADGERIVPSPSPVQDHDRRVFFGDRAPGAVADAPVNPLLWRRAVDGG